MVGLPKRHLSVAAAPQSKLLPGPPGLALCTDHGDKFCILALVDYLWGLTNRDDAQLEDTNEDELDAELAELEAELNQDELPLIHDLAVIQRTREFALLAGRSVVCSDFKMKTLEPSDRI